MDDPVSEWGQLLAYLPLIRRHAASGPSKVIFLPEPAMSSKNMRTPKEALGRIATAQGVSTAQLRSEARQELADWQDMQGTPGAFDGLLRLPQGR